MYLLNMCVRSLAFVHGNKFRANMTLSDKAEARNLRWKAHDAAQLVTGLRVRKVST